MGTCKFETFLVVPKFPWASPSFLDNMPDRSKMSGLLVPSYLTELFCSGCSQAF